ncbi:MAG: alpha amylase C-terminal domain-containing protein [Anaerolineae bacterium]|nr:alpha amylase C-terminal domain-containing protein [Anaerolineae bacterium]
MSKRLSIAILSILVFLLLVMFHPQRLVEAAPAASVGAQAGTPRTVYVHLFEWRYADVARECETYLGPKGFAAVQVSPPHEHLHIASEGYPWWERYQVVSYTINSRSGDRAAFQDMVERCNAVGVDIYADAVINHMSGYEGAPSFGGSTWSHYTYPGIYAGADFHYCGTPGHEINNYGDRWNVQNCELENLADLKTEDTYVRNRIRAYLSDLLSLGVDGFRIDAAKHIPAGDLDAILTGLARVPEGDAPFVFQEVIEAHGEPIQGDEYFGTGDVTEFLYGQEMYRIFGSGNVAEVSSFNDSKPGFMPSVHAMVFTDNHDKQRGHGGGGSYLTYKDGAKYALANVLMLAWPYGYPQVMSSYAFTDTDAGPPGTGGVIRAIYDSPTDTTPDCFGDWVCEHRWAAIGNMVAFRNATAHNFDVSDWWTNGYDAVAFGRGNVGYVVINGESFAVSRTFQTSMPAGTYCNVTDGELNAAGTGCTGTSITVDAGGRFTATVNAMASIAIHEGQKVTGGGGNTATVTFKVNATTYWGQNVYVVGNQTALGNWNPCNGVPMSAATYPVWSGTVSLPANTPIEFKFVKWEGSCQNVQWESSIGNRSLTTPASGGSMTTPTYNWNIP